MFRAWLRLRACESKYAVTAKIARRLTMSQSQGTTIITESNRQPHPMSESISNATPPKVINLITGNVNKLADAKAILEPRGFTVMSQALDLPEIQGTIEDITIAKCRSAADLVGGPVLVDDTALCFEAMNGMPGPYIKFFLEALGPEKLHLMLAGFPDKSAQAVATLCYSKGPGHEPVIFQGRTDGKIVPARGTLRYGWHACFEYGDTAQTFAEMDDAEKHKISHFGKAMAKLVAWMNEGGQ